MHAGQPQAAMLLPAVCREEREPLPPGRQYGNESPKRIIPEPADAWFFPYPGDWPADRGGIFWALRKKQTAAGKMLQKISV